MRTLNRPLFKQRVVALATQAADGADGPRSSRRVRPAEIASAGAAAERDGALPPPPAVRAPANALVSWIGWNAIPCGLTYVRTAPVCVSVTVMTTLTFVRPPAKTQNRLLTARPSTTLITTSTLFELKNQKYPVSPVRETAVAVPLRPATGRRP